MAVKFFGQFLMEKGVVSRETLLEAITLQESSNLKFGETALAMKIISDADVERVHDAQRTEDLRFGDMAVKLGLITEAQMKEVLTRQKNSHLYIGEALIKVGGINEGDLLGYLKDFKADQAPYMVEKILIPSEVSNPQVWEVVADLTNKMLLRVANLSPRVGQYKIVQNLEANDTVASMGFKGSVNGTYYLSVSSDIQEIIAKAILKEDSIENEPQEVLDDVVMEFVNITCGNISAKAAQLGKDFEIQPPDFCHPEGKNIEVPSGQLGLLLPFYLADAGKVEMAVFIKE